MKIATLPFIDHRRVRDTRRRPDQPRPTIAAIERFAASIAGGIVVAGPIFWAALILAFIAVNLGIIS